MKIYKVYVSEKGKYKDHLEEEIINLGVKDIKIKEYTVYWISSVSYGDVRRLANKVLHNPLVEELFINKLPRRKVIGAKKVEVLSNLGVIDPRESSVKKAALDLGVSKELKVKFGRLYLIFGKIKPNDLKTIKKRSLMKEVIEHEVKKFEDPFIKAPKYKFKLVSLPLVQANNRQLSKISSEGGLSLTLAEMKEIKKHFQEAGQDPTDVELETIAQTWSEHCSHKTLKGSVVHNGKIIDNLLKTYILDPSEKLNKKYVLSAFKDNAGGIKIGNSVVCIKVETHNHPSALEPVGGSETGIGGVIRDILGFGIGAKPISSIVCFGVGPQKINYDKLPQGVLHPKNILSGIVEGTKSYGNQIGIPTDFFQDSLVVHKDYLGNPLVYCGTVGVANINHAKKSNPKKGELILLVGGLTGRDGIHGVTFSSASLEEKSDSISGGAVQIGDAIMEKKTLDATLEMRDSNLIKFITDCGGGGLSSAVGETGSKVGVKVYLDKVPKKYEGLSYTEIWISESQERMVVVIEPRNRKKALQICEKHSVPAMIIGEFTGNKKLELFYEGNRVANLDMKLLHHGCPRIKRVSNWEKIPPKKNKKITPDLAKIILKVLQDPDVRSKSQFAHQYDSTVQGRTIGGPLVGLEEKIHVEATVRQIAKRDKKGVAVAISINPNLTRLNPRKMSHWVITQALAKLAAVGADSTKAALLDNFSWGAPTSRKIMGELVESLVGCKDVIDVYRVPFISGKDSLYNEFRNKKSRVSIPGTLLITAIAPISDVRKAVNITFEKEGNKLYQIGLTDGNLGGSSFSRSGGQSGGDAPKINLTGSRLILPKISKLINQGVIKSASVVGKGGLAAAIAKMILASSIGAKIDISKIKKKTNLSDTQVLFSESGPQFIVEIQKIHESKIKATFGRRILSELGIVGGRGLSMTGADKIVDLSLARLVQSYTRRFS